MTASEAKKELLEQIKKLTQAEMSKQIREAEEKPKLSQKTKLKKPWLKPCVLVLLIM